MTSAGQVTKTSAINRKMLKAELKMKKLEKNVVNSLMKTIYL
jgi:hypothetical protein